LETFVGNALFGDGSGSVVVGARPTEKEKTLWIVEGTKSRILEHTPELMTWEASDKGSSRACAPMRVCVMRACRVVSCRVVRN
jgi:predicted naringenin-chalcone synthase